MAKKKLKKKKHQTGAVLLYIFMFVLLLTAALSFAAFSASAGNRIFPDVYIDGICVGDMNREEARAALQDAGWITKAETPVKITVCGTITAEADRVTAGVYPNVDQILEDAYGYGREGNLISNFIDKIRLRGQAVDVYAGQRKVNESYASQIASDCAMKFEQSLGTGGYTVDMEQMELSLVKGQGSAYLDEDGLKDAILDALANDKETVDFSTLSGIPTMPDFESIWNAVCHEMKNAEFSTDGTHVILPEQTGLTFDVETAAQLWENASIGDLIRIPMKQIEPEVTKQELESSLYLHLLGACTTKYNNSNDNRSNNVRLAAEKINGTVLFPGEEFSFNDVVGRRTLEAGFLPATAYADLNNVQQEVGGGVCQVSTTLYASTLFAFLKTTERTCHIYPPNYIRVGMDATVTIPENGGTVLDFKFRNNKNYPIKVVAYCEETYVNGYPSKTITMEIWGTLEDDDLMPIEFDNSYLGVFDYDRVIEPAFEDREGYKIKFTHEEVGFEEEDGHGLRALTHRLIYSSDGVLLDDTIINPIYGDGYAMDTYYLH